MPHDDPSTPAKAPAPKPPSPPGGRPPLPPSEAAELKKASDGLLYPSESDEPFEVFHWPASPSPTPSASTAALPGQSVVRQALAGPPAPGAVAGNDPARARVAAHAGAGRAIEEVPADKFFAALDGSDDAERYRQLRRVLEAQLSGLKIYRVGEGEVRVDVFLVGKARSGDWVGLHTVSVET